MASSANPPGVVEESDPWMAAPLADFLDPSVNSYRHLHHDDQQPWFRARLQEGQGRRRDANDEDEDELNAMVKRTFGLRVKNLPQGLEASGVRNIFSRHGKVIDVDIINTKPRWAKVLFSSHMEAQMARYALHGEAPFNLEVYTLAPPRQQTRETKDQREDSDGRQQEQVVPEEFSQWGKNVEWEEEVARQAQEVQEADQVARQPDDQDQVAPQPQDVKEIYQKASPTPAAKVSSVRQEEAADSEVRTFGHRVLLPFCPPGDCSNVPRCRRRGRYRCARCKAWYCSQLCQVDHWGKHMVECWAPPPLQHPDGIARTLLQASPPDEEARKRFRDKLFKLGKDATKVDTTKVDTKKVDTTKVETTKVDTMKVDTTKVDTTKVDTTVQQSGDTSQPLPSAPVEQNPTTSPSKKVQEEKVTEPEVFKAKKQDELSRFPSALDALQVGDTLQLYASEADGDPERFSSDAFLAVCCDRSGAFDYVFGDFQDRMEELFCQGKLENVKDVARGQLVLAKEDVEFCRSLVLGKADDGKVKIFNVDNGSRKSCSRDSIFAPPQQAFSPSVPFLCVKAVKRPRSNQDDELTARFLEDPMIDTVVGYKSQDELVVSLKSDQSPEAPMFDLLPWWAFDAEVAAIFM